MSCFMFWASNTNITGKPGLSVFSVLNSVCRWDRDEYVTVNMENIKEDMKHNFKIRHRNGDNSSSLPYEYCSIMHYSGQAFTKVIPLLPTPPSLSVFQNGRETITPKKKVGRCPGGGGMGQRNRLTDLDVKKIKKFYDCE